ncbi:hypothetical protein VTJ04DRAFT_9438 [Mycothermus thermophilus]|uniref:uncharacterized protein n=1 Tax=Humicola insolens TaxID=85995 RepID=UPI0037439ED7
MHPFRTPVSPPPWPRNLGRSVWRRPPGTIFSSESPRRRRFFSSFPTFVLNLRLQASPVFIVCIHTSASRFFGIFTIHSLTS